MASSVTLLCGDCRKVMSETKDKVFQCVITSPPYWGLRDYGVSPVVWGGEPDCKHEWEGRRFYSENSAGGSSAEAFSGPGQENSERVKKARWKTEHRCRLCGAWRGSLGLEPTPELYVEHMVEVFREVRRVLRDDGVLWLNLGDTFARNPKKGDNSGWGKHADWCKDPLPLHARPCPLPEKNLVGIPWRVAFALQADGWYLRGDPSWVKKNGMPGSQQDRPTMSHEYVFLFSKSSRYYYDQTAVKRAISESSKIRISQSSFFEQKGGDKDYSMTGINPYASARRALENFMENSEQGRTLRTSDFLFDSLDRLIDEERNYLAHLEYIKKHGGMLCDEEGMPLAFSVNLKGYKGAHFATFPKKLVEPMVLAGTSARGCCPVCGAPWERITERTGHTNKREAAYVPGSAETKTDSTGWKPLSRGTNKWRPTCDCGREAVPCAVLDPFAGTATVGEVCLETGRRFVGIDLNAEYIDLQKRRLEGVQMGFGV